jgi:hypothetical protein
MAAMPSTPVSQLIPVLQVAIGPVILISGVGLLLLTLTNRFGRAIDRSRQLGGAVREANEAERARLAAQVDIIYRRARVIRLSIIMAVWSVLLVSILIIVLFISAMLHLEAAPLLAILFIGCMACLIVSLVAFIRDIQLSLKALVLELDRTSAPVAR